MTSKNKRRIVVEGVELTVEQTGDFVNVCRVIGQDRARKIDITSGRTFRLDDTAVTLIDRMKDVAAYKTVRCTCDYRYGYSDHAEHCQSIYVASYDGACVDDD